MKALALSALLVASPAIASSTVTILAPDEHMPHHAAWQIPGGPWIHMHLHGDTFEGLEIPDSVPGSIFLKLDDLMFDLPNPGQSHTWHVDADTTPWPNAIGYIGWSDHVPTEFIFLTPEPVPEPASGSILLLSLGLMIRRHG